MSVIWFFLMLLEELGVRRNLILMWQRVLSYCFNFKYDVLYGLLSRTKNVTVKLSGGELSFIICQFPNNRCDEVIHSFTFSFPHKLEIYFN